MNIDRLLLSDGVIGYSRGELSQRWRGRGYIEQEDSMALSSSDHPRSSNMAGNPRTVQNLPPRCGSEPICHCHNAGFSSRVGERLEDDPQRVSSSLENNEDWQRLSKMLQSKAVTFSENSTMQIYLPDPHYARTKSYTKIDRKRFRSETISEAIRIRRLVNKTPGASTKESFKYLLKNGIISLEEMVGIEHLVLGKSVAQLVKERKNHARAVLAEHGRQRSYLEGKMQGDPTGNLGQFSVSRSIKSVNRARIRAAMAA